MSDIEMDLFGGETEYVSTPNRPTAPARRVAPVVEQLAFFEVVASKVGGEPLIYTEPELF